jgi:endonuclease/exonuclease/phosphatase (EEP) superfamily protein YafD
MTANLLEGRADPRHLAETLEHLDPDVLLTQELGDRTAEVIAAHFEHSDLRPEEESAGRGIASRFPARFGEIPLPWRPGLWATIDLPRPFLMGNIHMHNPIVFPWWRSVRIRGDQLDALFQWVEDHGDPDTPLVLAGDMNASPAWPVYRRLAGQWDDLIALWSGESGWAMLPTWAWRPGWPRVLRIDHVFGRGARVVATRVEPLWGTDHAAVVVDVAFD